MKNKEEIDIDESLILRYFSGESCETDNAAVEEWIAASEDNRRIAAQVSMLCFSAATLKTMRETDVESALWRVKKQIRTNRMRIHGRRIQKAAAILFIPLLAFAGYLAMKDVSAGEEILEVHTNPGMVTYIHLPDGSQVWLNSGTTIRYPKEFRGKNREVAIDGEAYFDVTRDEKKKFVVATPENVRLEVLGTEFNVDAYGGSGTVSATLVSGKVNFIYYDAANATANVVMKPSQKVEFSIEAASARISSVNTSVDTAWREGRIIFQNTSMEDVIRILGRRFSVEFIVKDKSVMEQRFTGSFGRQRLERILEHFEVSSGIKYRFIEPDPGAGSAEADKSIIEIY